MLSKLQPEGETMRTTNRATAYGEFYEVISRSLRSQLDGDLLVIFDKIKPVCDAVVARPSIDNLSKFSSSISKLQKEVVQCLHQYLFFPLMSRIKCVETRKKIDIHIKVLETVMMLLERITVNNYDMFLKLESSLLTIIFDSNKPGMISDAKEEVKHSTLRCLTTLMLHLTSEVREKLLNTQVPMLAQAVFVAVHIAKLEKLRVLRLAAIDCVLAHTMTHPYYDSVEYGKLTTNGRVSDPALELLIVDKLLANILPGVLAALQDVAVDKDNPGHAVVTAAIEATHRILCLPMHNKYLEKKNITIKDFMNVIKTKHGKDNNTEVSNRGNKNPRDMEKRSREWFTMAGEKLTLITKSLVALRTHEHFKVRKELAVFCYRIITECNNTMPESVPLCLDVLISLSKDDYPEVTQYCTTAINNYFANASEETRNDTMDSLCDNFVTLLTTLPRILNNIDSNRKISSLNLLVGYLETLSVGSRLSTALSSARTAQLLCETLTQAAEHTHTNNLIRVVTRDVTSSPPLCSPWSNLTHLDPACWTRLQAACTCLAATQVTGTLLDVLTQYYEREREAGTLWVMNSMMTAPNCPHEMVKRILETYLDDELWYNPIEQDVIDADEGETLDVTVYNPRAWTKDTVPDLYEGTIETRYTDIPLSTPARGGGGPPSTRAPSAHARLTLACLLTEGVGNAALALKDCYQPYLMKTLCLVLERVGSDYILVHLAGLKAISAISRATGHDSVTGLIRDNADYITNRITASLKKAWNCESALEILSVVMAYSDVTMLDCLYAIVEDVLVQSCDKFYERNLNSYLQVFLTFLECIQKWFPYDIQSSNSNGTHQLEELDLLKEVEDYVKYTLEAERLLSDSEWEKSGEDSFEEDAKRKEDNVMDYDDTVTTEKPPLPSHIKVSISIIKRSIHFISSPSRDTSLLAIRVASLGVLVLRRYEDDLLPLVHAIWSPLVAKFSSQDAVVLRHSCDLLVVLAECSKDFIRSRSLKEVLPTLYKFLKKSSKDSYLKDVGSSYRTTAAYSLQERALAALAPLTVHLGLEGDSLTQAMDCVQLYLSNKQPKPLQTTAIEFFKKILSYDYGAAWLHLRALCDNDVTLQPPTTTRIDLQPVVGTPYQASDKQYDGNIKVIFGIE